MDFTWERFDPLQPPPTCLEMEGGDTNAIFYSELSGKVDFVQDNRGEEEERREIYPAFQLATSLTVGEEREIELDPLLTAYRPRTRLGEILLKLRKAYFQADGRPLDWEAIQAEIRGLRGDR